MLTAFYILVAICAAFVILSLQVVRAHEKKQARREAEEPADRQGPEAQEEEFFRSPIYRAMEVIAHM